MFVQLRAWHTLISDRIVISETLICSKSMTFYEYEYEYEFYVYEMF